MLQRGNLQQSCVGLTLFKSEIGREVMPPASKPPHTYGGSVLQRGSVQQSRVGLTLKSEIGREVTPPASKPPYTQTAARVAAVLAKSAAATQPPSHHQRPQFFGHNPNLKRMFCFKINHYFWFWKGCYYSNNRVY